MLDENIHILDPSFEPIEVFDSMIYKTQEGYLCPTTYTRDGFVDMLFDTLDQAILQNLVSFITYHLDVGDSHE